MQLGICLILSWEAQASDHYHEVSFPVVRRGEGGSKNALLWLHLFTDVRMPTTTKMHLIIKTFPTAAST